MLRGSRTPALPPTPRERERERDVSAFAAARVRVHKVASERVCVCKSTFREIHAREQARDIAKTRLYFASLAERSAGCSVGF